MKLVLKADRLIDGTGSDPVRDAAVVVKDGRISEVTTQDKLQIGEREDVDVIDVAGGTLMPGFIEMHSHIHCSARADAYTHITTESNETFIMRGVGAVRAALSSGVTTMRDLGSRNEVILPIKSAIENGIIPGPRLIAAGTPITTTGGHCNMFGTEADTAEEVVTAIRTQFKLGADCIKVMSTGGGFTPGTNVRAPQYPVETLKAAVSRRRAPWSQGRRPLPRLCRSQELRRCGHPQPDPLLLARRERRGHVRLRHRVHRHDRREGHLRRSHTRARTAELSARSSAKGRRTGMGDPARRFEILRDMWDRGVMFVTGMDSGMTNANFDDFAYIPQVMVEEMHITPMEAIVCSTQTSAECLGLEDEIGTLEAGKSADVVIVNGDPSEDITALHNVNAIVTQGAVVKRDNELLF